jgi:hypothetical protein
MCVLSKLESTYVKICPYVGDCLHMSKYVHMLPFHNIWTLLGKMQNFKTCAFTFSEMENFKTCTFTFESMRFENRFCTGSGRRTPPLKFVKNSYGFVGPSVMGRLGGCL